MWYVHVLQISASIRHMCMHFTSRRSSCTVFVINCASKVQCILMVFMHEYNMYIFDKKTNYKHVCHCIEAYVSLPNSSGTIFLWVRKMLTHSIQKPTTTCTCISERPVTTTKHQHYIHVQSCMLCTSTCTRMYMYIYMYCTCKCI